MCKCRFDLHYFSHTNETAFENNGEVNNLFTSRSTLTDELSRLVFAELSDIEGLNISVSQPGTFDIRKRRDRKTCRMGVYLGNLKRCNCVVSEFNPVAYSDLNFAI